MMESTAIWWFLAILPVVSFLYASVGHGGASGYLALMALFAFPQEMMKSTALILNLFVAGVSFYHYYRGGHFRPQLFWGFALTSVPLSFLGGTLELDAADYRKILGTLLIFAVVRMFMKEREKEWTTSTPLLASLFVGGVIGLFSGLIGIGGGIILTPLLILFHWAKVKESAAISALFIWVNSAAGLAGQLHSGVQLDAAILPMIGLAMAGGFLGSFYGSMRWNSRKLKFFLGGVLALASLKLLWI